MLYPVCGHAVTVIWESQRRNGAFNHDVHSVLAGAGKPALVLHQTLQPIQGGTRQPLQPIPSSTTEWFGPDYMELRSFTGTHSASLLLLLKKGCRPASLQQQQESLCI